MTDARDERAASAHPDDDDRPPSSVAAALADARAGETVAPETVERVMRAVRVRATPVRPHPRGPGAAVPVAARRTQPWVAPSAASGWRRGALSAAALGAVLVGAASVVRTFGEPRRTAGTAAAPAFRRRPALGGPSGDDLGEPVRRVAHFAVLAPGAHRVAVVGDFNGWRAQATRMQHDSATGLWTASLPLPEGRYVYAYLVDDTRWMSDPNAPLAPADGFGRQSSVLVLSARYAVR